MNKKKITAFQVELNYFHGKSFSTFHRSIGSLLSFDCGERRNDFVPDGIFLECCSWYLRDKRKIICSSVSRSKAIEAGARSVLNENILAVKFFTDTQVLAVFFDNGRTLCALPIEATGCDHWSVFIGGGAWILGSGLRLKHETYDNGVGECNK
jgi:hypothetical protein